jgi:hypothetical protein
MSHPDTIITDSNFARIRIGDVYVTPTGSTQTTLAAALASGGGGAVTSVAGRTGVVVITSSDLADFATAVATAVTLSVLQTLVATAPTSLPSGSGVLWLNGGVLQLS